MTTGIERICALSVLCGLVLHLCPEGGVKKITAIGCTLLLMLSALELFPSFDGAAFSLESARYREMAQALSEDAAQSRERLNRLVIERECEEYIESRAAALGIAEPDAEVRAEWDCRGFWAPRSARLSGRWSPEQEQRLGDLIAAELGIERECQEWNDEQG